VAGIGRLVGDLLVALCTFVLLKVVGIFIPLRMSQENMEIGDVAEHGHEVYPSDIRRLGSQRDPRLQRDSGAGRRMTHCAVASADEQRPDGTRSRA